MKIVDLVLLFILVMAVFFVTLLIWAKGSRLFKKKSYHYLVPPKPEKDKNWYPVDFSRYKSFIFLKNFSENQLVEKLNCLLDHNTQIKAVDIELNKKEEWILLKIKNCSFKDLKMLVWSLYNDNNDVEIPAEVIGFCQHKSIALHDYIFKIDDDIKLERNYFIGSFRNGRNFGVYLPNVGLTEKGNISLSRNQEINFYSEITELPVELIEENMISFEKAVEYYFENH